MDDDDEEDADRRGDGERRWRTLSSWLPVDIHPPSAFCKAQAWNLTPVISRDRWYELEMDEVMDKACRATA